MDQVVAPYLELHSYCFENIEVAIIDVNGETIFKGRINYGNPIFPRDWHPIDRAKLYLCQSGV